MAFAAGDANLPLADRSGVLDQPDFRFEVLSPLAARFIKHRREPFTASSMGIVDGTYAACESC